MSKEIVVNIGERETRIAVLEESRLVELHIERAERVVGSLYKCRVVNVLQGMDAAFVDIGLERNAFLYVGDVLPTVDENGIATAGGAPRAASPGRTGQWARDNRRSGPRAEPSAAGGTDDANPEAVVSDLADGPIPVESEETPLTEEDELAPLLPDPDLLLGMQRAETLADQDTAESDEPDGILEEIDEPEVVENESPVEPGSRAAVSIETPFRRTIRRSVLRNQRIKDVLKVGQELLVQVIKGPRSTKGARVSTRISLPGRYLVLMPEADHLGVSRKIEDPKERDRLKKIGEHLREPGFGLIIRTEAEEKSETELQQDKEFLMRTWRQVQETARKVRAPALVQPDLTLLYKTIRDVFGSDVSKLVIDDPAEYQKANELLDRLSPKLKGRVHLYDGTKPIFDHFELEAEIERSLRRKVYLKSGASLVIDETEGLTVIDVNSSKFTGANSLAETILRTNQDAAREIARQLRLRDIGGIIVIDFIDMNNARDKQHVIKALEVELKKDRSRTKISHLSPLGLLEMTRKRTGETLSGLMTDDCPYCKGRGHLPSPESVSIAVERELRRQINLPQNAKKDAFLITCHQEVAELLIGPEGASIDSLERQAQKVLYVRCDEDAHIEKYSIEARDLMDLEKNQPLPRREQVLECRIVRSLLKEPNRCIGWSGNYLIDLNDGARFIGQKAKVKVTDVRRSYADGALLPGTNRPLDH